MSYIAVPRLHPQYLTNYYVLVREAWGNRATSSVNQYFLHIYVQTTVLSSIVTPTLSLLGGSNNSPAAAS